MKKRWASAETWLWAALIGVVLVWVLAVFAFSLYGLAAFAHLAAFVLVVVLLVIDVRLRVARRRALKRQGRGLCPACSYALVGLAAGSVCPECGKAGSHSEPDLRGS